jgi:hypothetical protein
LTWKKLPECLDKKNAYCYGGRNGREIGKETTAEASVERILVGYYQRNLQNLNRDFEGVIPISGRI